MSANLSKNAVAHSPRIGPASAHRLSRWGVVLLIAYGSSLLLLNLGDTRALTFHEVLFAEPAREMLQTGNWILPHFAGVPSTHKPPATEWLIAAAMTLGGSRDEAVVRLPSVFAAIGTALLISTLAARWFGARIGLLAGLMQLTAYATLQMARLAEADMPLTFFVCAAMTVFAFANVESPQGRKQARWMPWLFYTLAGLAFLTKGLIGPIIIFGAASAYTAYRMCCRDFGSLRFLLSPVGIGIYLFCMVGWFYAAYQQYPPLLDDQLYHHLDRFEGELGGQKPPLFYVYSILLVTLPWAPLLVWGLIRGVRERRYRDSFWAFAVCWVVPGLSVLWSSTFQSKHYLCPLVPPMLVIAAVMLPEYILRRQQLSGRLHALTAALAIVGTGIGAFVVSRAQPEGARAILVLIAMLGVGLLTAIYFEYRRHMTAQLLTLFGTAWLLITGIFSYVIPHHDSYRDLARLAERTDALVPDGEKVYLVDLVENQIAFYLDQQMARIDHPEQMTARLPEADPDVYVLTPQRLINQLRGLGSLEVLEQCGSVNDYLDDEDRVTLVRLSRVSQVAAENVERN